MLITAGGGDKTCKIWRCEDKVELVHEFKNGKKITSLCPVDFVIGGKTTRGLIFADKFGEVRFFNFNRIGLKEEESKEETVAD